MKALSVLVLSLVLLLPAKGQDTPKTLPVREIGVNLDLPLAYLMLHLYESPNDLRHTYFALDYKQGQKHRLVHLSLNYTRDYHDKYIHAVYGENGIGSEIDYIPGYGYPGTFYNDSIRLLRFSNYRDDRIGIEIGMEWRSGNKVQFIHGPKLSYGLTMIKRSLWVVSTPRYGSVFNSTTLQDEHENTLASTFGLTYKAGGLFSISEHFKLTLDLSIGYVLAAGLDIRETEELKLYRHKLDADANHPILRSDISLFYRF